MNTKAWRRNITAAILVAAVGACSDAATQSVSYTAAEGIPRTDKPFAADAGDFSFVVVGDRTGGHRPGVFEHAMKQINWLHPEFVINIGDLIEGYMNDEAAIAAQWDGLRPAIDGLDMPFFFVPGNHDISNDVMAADWKRRFGPSYYHFVYKDVLFLALNTEDPPPRATRRELAAQYGADATLRVLQALQGDPREAETLFAAEPRLGELAKAMVASDSANFSDAQIAYVEKALRENPKVRWTFVLMHRPAWRQDGGFQRIEALLRGRAHTVLAGHYHTYRHEDRGGTDYIQMGTTGGEQRAGQGLPGTMDHVMMVTMTPAGPQYANIRQDGLTDKYGPQAAATSSSPP